MIDLHSHLLPGIDDGPASVEDALALARAAAAAGTRTIVATPHIDHRWKVEPTEVPDMVQRMREALSEAHIELDVRVGGEISLPRLADLDAAEVDAVRLGGGPYILLECPHRATAATGFPTTVRYLRRRGESIILAHPERSPTFQRTPAHLAALVREGVLTSITAASLLGTFGTAIQSFSLRLLRDGLVHNVASDAHEIHRRGPELLSGLQAAERQLPGVLGQADWLTREVPAAVLAGSALPARPELPPRRSGPRRWFRGGR